MSRIVRISPSAFPHLPVRTKAKEAATAAPDTNNIRTISAPRNAGEHTRTPSHTGPSTPFLAQYVNQHWPWPRDANARIRARTMAAGAYDTTGRMPLCDIRGRQLKRNL